MKSTFRHFLLIFLSLSAYGHQALSQKKYLIVNYETTPISPNLLTLLKAQMKDPVVFNDMVNKISKNKFFYTLVIDLKNKKSVYYMDSLHAQKNIYPIGYNISSVRSADGKISSNEKMVNVDYLVNGTVEELKWDISKETAQINKYQTVKAASGNSPDITVWFTPDLNVNFGPSYLCGLPGLILKIDTFYDQTIATKISYSNNPTKFQKLTELINTNKTASKVFSIDKISVTRNNFVKILAKKITINK